MTSTEVELIDITPDAMKKLAQVAAVCYQVPPSEKVVKKIVKLGHLSVLEHCYATFRFKMSVACLLQLTRHRHFSFTIQSSRHTELTQAHWPGGTADEVIAGELEQYNRVYNADGPEKALYCIPKAALYEGYVTGNFRAWYEYLQKRLCLRAMYEHREFAMKVRKALDRHYPDIFDSASPQCVICCDSSCPFVAVRGKDDEAAANDPK